MKRRNRKKQRQAQFHAHDCNDRMLIVSRLRVTAFFFLIMVVFVMLAWGSASVYQAWNRPISSLKVLGDLNHVSVNDIQAVLDRSEISGYLSLDLGKLHEALNSLEWVESVSVRRVWPDVLRVKIIERKAFAKWADGGFVTKQGQLFFPADEQVNKELPILDGPEGSHVLLSNSYREMASHLAKIGLHIDFLGMDNRHSWQLTLDNGMKVLLGRLNEMNKLESFLEIYTAMFAENSRNIEQVDFRYSNGFAVRQKVV